MGIWMFGSAGLPPLPSEQGSLVNTLREVEPTSHMGVPRVWEKIMERIQEVSAQSGFIRRKMLQWAMAVTLEHNLTCPGRYGGQDEESLGQGSPGLAGQRVIQGLGHPWEQADSRQAERGSDPDSLLMACPLWP